jgi:Ca2+-binding RTX toxin-like protein
MTCPNSGEAIHLAVRNYIEKLKVAPTLGGQLMDRVAHHMDGEVYDPSLMDMAEATGVSNALEMGIEQALVNRGRHIAGNIVSATPDVVEGAQTINGNIDRNPDGGPGTCDDPTPPSGDPNDPNNPNGPNHPPTLPPNFPWWLPRGWDWPSNPGGRRSGDGDGGGHGAVHDPLIIDLDGDGIELTLLADSSVHFDFDSDGFAEKTGWVQPDDGLIVFDRNGNGQIDDGTEMFGGAGIDGFTALAVLDSNSSGQFDILDADFVNVQVWRDLNGDGYSSASELFSLQAVGVASIGLATDYVGTLNAGNQVANSGSAQLFAGGSHLVESIYFAVDTAATQYVVPDNFEYDELTEILPDLKGFGTVRDLSVAVSQDPLLMQSLRALIIDSNGMSAADFRERVIDLVADWAGVDGAAHDGRGQYVDYDKLAVVEAFQGAPFWEQTISSKHAEVVADRYDSIIDGVMARLAVQMAGAYFALSVVDGNECNIFEHSLSAFGTYFYDVKTDTIDGRPDLFIALATGFLSGTATEQFASFEGLLDYLPALSGVLYNGDQDALANMMSNILDADLNFSDMTLESCLIALQYDVTCGTNGADTIIGDSGVGAFDGGLGNDHLIGGDGDDLYIFGPGYGQDIVTDSISLINQGGHDRIWIGGGLTPADVTVTQVNGGRDLVISINGTSDQLTLQNTSADGWARIEEVGFGDGAVLSHADLIGLATAPTAGDDLFYGSTANDSLSGGAGNDTLYAWAGADIVHGGTGNDIMIGGGGDDTYQFNLGDGLDVVRDQNGLTEQGGFDVLVFGAGITTSNIVVSQTDNGNDIVIGIGGSDQVMLDNVSTDNYAIIEELHFADGAVLTHAQLMALATAPTSGNDTFYGSTVSDVLSGGGGNDLLIGRLGADTLHGGTGNDTLVGGGGGDVYLFNLGDGQDIVSDSNGLIDQGGLDELRFGAGITASGITVAQADNGNDLVISIAGSTDKVTLNDASSNGYARIETIRFDDGTVLTYSQLLEMATGATPGTDSFTGTSGADRLYGGRGDDTLLGKLGSDRLEGGEDNDQLKGGGGDDAYYFDPGFGQDVVTDDDGLTNRGGVDNVTFGAGIGLADLTFSQADTGKDIVISVVGTTDKITLNDAAINGYCIIEEIRFADGTVLTHSQMMALATAPTSGNDVFYGSTVDDVLLGGAGDDTLAARAGNDSLTGGAGNDITIGGGGDDIYVFNLGDGQDIVRDSNGSLDQGGIDELRLGTGIAAFGITVAQADNGNDLVISINGTFDRVTLDDTYSNGWAQIERVRFADGTVLTHADLMALARQARSTSDSYWGETTADMISGGGGDDTIWGRAGNDTLSGDDGNDNVNGEDGDDALSGGAGNDVLNGGNGIDTLAGGDGDDMFLPGAGVDTVYGDAGSDTVDVSALTLAMTIDLALASSQANLGTNGLESWYDVENVIAGTAADIVYGTSGANRLSGRNGVDSLYGRDGNDILVGGTGDDTMDGGAGDDVFEIAAGDGSDFIGGGDGFDTIIATAASVALLLRPLSSIEAISSGGFANVTISLTSGADTFNFASVALTGIARIDGLAGADVITGSAGADTIAGGTGDDTLGGGSGDDVFLYGTSGDGFDNVSGGDGQDMLVATGNNVYIGLHSLNTIETISSGGYSGVYIAGSGAADTLDFSGTTMSGIVRIDAGSGNDAITGSAGSDTIIGNSGNDWLNGGGGVDTLTGSAGTDVFAFGEGGTSLGASADRITDFAVGSDDIDLTAIDANVNSGGDQAFAFIGSAAFSGVAGELRFEKIGSDTWIQMDTDGDGAANMAIVLSGSLTPLLGDFVL